MRERLEEFSLSLHPEKTRLIEFGRLAAAKRARRGLGKPETFRFLGFTFISGRNTRGKFQLCRKTRGDRMQAKFREIKEELRRRRHRPIPDQGAWLRQVVAGFFRLPRGADKQPCPPGLPERRRNPLVAQPAAARPAGPNDVGKDEEIGRRVAPQAAHPSSLAFRALCRQTPEVGAVCGNSARTVLCGGRSVMSVPTAIT